MYNKKHFCTVSYCNIFELQIFVFVSQNHLSFPDKNLTKIKLQRCVISERTNSKWRALHVNNVNIINVKEINNCFANTSILGDIAP